MRDTMKEHTMSGTQRLGLFLLLLVPIACTPINQTPHPLVGAQAPDVELQLLGGGMFGLAKHLDKDIVILDFWATWCGPCRQSMPEIVGVANEYAGKGVVLYTVNQGDSPEAIRNFLQTIDVQCAVALDPIGEAALPYGALAIPQTVIIDKKGRVQEVYEGYGSGLPQQMRRDLDALLASKSLVGP